MYRVQQRIQVLTETQANVLAKPGGSGTAPGHDEGDGSGSQPLHGGGDLLHRGGHTLHGGDQLLHGRAHPRKGRSDRVLGRGDLVHALEEVFEFGGGLLNGCHVGEARLVLGVLAHPLRRQCQ